jgi:hypothetical protein
MTLVALGSRSTVSHVLQMLRLDPPIRFPPARVIVVVDESALVPHSAHVATQ